MQQLFEFIVNHWILVVAFLVILGLLIYNLITGNKGSVGPLEATEMMNRRDAVVIDVRPAAEYVKGHIIDAINIPFNGFKNQLATLNKYKGRPIIVSCRSGGSSATACMQLRKAGFEDVYNLQGGIMAWESANLPLSTKKR